MLSYSNLMYIMLLCSAQETEHEQKSSFLTSALLAHKLRKFA